MHYKKIIQSVTAGLLILLFTVSATPKQWLHDFLTGHKHCYAQSEETNGVRESRSGYQCNWVNPELESPFNIEPIFTTYTPTVVYPTHEENRVGYFYSSQRILSSLRGPPAIA
ncbi:MAG: hypothetical protein H7Y42_17435 [Chitinophagaceae bacterium]|nr:hypothetical protein [Chitinophagaceae bacterium]